MKEFFTHKTIEVSLEDFTDIYDRYMDMIYRFIYFKIPSKEDAQDLSAEVFMDLYKYLQKQKVSNCQAFLYKCARNKIVDYYRMRKDQLCLDQAEDVKDTDRGNGLEQSMHMSHELEKIQQYMQTLPQAYQDIIILRYVEGYSVQETARILKKSTGATRILSHRALKALQQCLINSSNN